ncbi:MAG: hypothetical protein SFV20_03725 [Sphingopyxis sp.]|nr:hypothetical protein [Sphingopyxis sp.]
MRPVFLFAACFSGMLSAPLAAAQAQAAQAPVAQPETPVAAIEILPIDFAGGTLGGAGGDRLRGALTDAQFIALGEDHGLAGPPQLAHALANAAQALPNADPLFHAVEVGPITTKWTQDLLAKGGLAALDRALDGRALTMPFLSNVEDAALAAPFARQGRLFGIDQEFVGAPILLLEMLAARTRDTALRKQLEAATKADIAAIAEGRFNDLWLFKTDAAAVAALRQRFARDTKAQAIFDALAVSAEVYRLNNVGRYLENNEQRTALIQRYFLDAWNNASPRRPRVLFKMGASHMGRGTTPPWIYDIGSLLPGLAASEGKRSLHVLYLPLAGKTRAIRPSASGLTAVTDVNDQIVGPMLSAAGVDPAGLPATGHVLIPLAPLRHAVAANKKLRDLPHDVRFMLLGFDYLVTTRDAAAATSFEAN